MHNPAWFMSTSARTRYFTGALAYFAQGIPCLLYTSDAADE